MKPEAKRNEEKHRRARARIHDTYKAVGVDLIPKGRMAQAPRTAATAFPHGPGRSPGPGRLTGSAQTKRPTASRQKT